MTAMLWRFVSIGAFLASVLIGLACARPALAQPSSAVKATGAPSGNQENGKKLYSKVGCWACHGLEAQGAGTYGPRLGPSPVPFPAFLAYIRVPSGEMPPYIRRVLSDQDAADIYAFVQSRPANKSPKDLPLLQ